MSDKVSGAGRALVPAASSQQAVSTKGFDHGEGRIDHRGTLLSPCAIICPECGADTDRSADGICIDCWDETNGTFGLGA